jgi:hypothetical protein
VIPTAALPGVGTGDVACFYLSDERSTRQPSASKSDVESAREHIKFVSLVYSGLTGGVRNRLKSQPELAEFLVAAYVPLIMSFGDIPRLRLSEFSDPESEGSHSTLVVNVQTQLSVDDAMRRLDSFDNSWFLEHMDDVAGRITFVLSFP